MGWIRLIWGLHPGHLLALPLLGHGRFLSGGGLALRQLLLVGGEHRLVKPGSGFLGAGKADVLVLAVACRKRAPTQSEIAWEEAEQRNE